MSLKRLQEAAARKEAARENDLRQLDAVPEELKSLQQWVVWKRVDRDGKTTKQPFSPHTRQLARTDNPTTWVSFDDAMKALKASGYDGIGFVFTDDDPYVGIDVDNVIDENGQLATFAEEIVDRLALASYIEVSPSGKGLHVIVKGRKPGPRCKRPHGESVIEMYDQGRYFTITGERWGDDQPDEIGDGQEAVDEIYARLLDDSAGGTHEVGAGDEDPVEPDHEKLLNLADTEPVLQRAFAAKNGNDIRALWLGDITRYKSSSEADLALCSYLAYWTDKNPAEVDRLFRMSGIMRPQWEERDDYRLRTLKRVCNGDPSQMSQSQTAKNEVQQEEGSQLSQSQIAESGAQDREKSQLSQSQTGWDFSQEGAQPSQALSFPVDALPPVVRQFVNETAEVLGVDPCMVGAACLAAMAGCIGNRRRIELSGDWQEYPIVWIALVMRSGGKKTPCLKKVLGYLLSREIKILKEYEKKNAAWNGTKKEDRGPRPKPPERLMVNDTTIEALLMILADSPLGLLLYRDELDAWLKSFDQYRQRGGDTQAWLEMHQGNAAFVDRKTTASVSVPRASVSVIGGIQPPTLMRSLAGENLENGLAARLFLAVPAEMPSYWTEAVVSAEAKTGWQKVLDSLLGLEPKQSIAFAFQEDFNDPEPVDLPMKAEAKTTWIAFKNALADRIFVADDPIRATLSKIEAGTARLALIVQLARDPDSKEVDEAAMHSGIELGLWFEAQAEQFYGGLEAAAEADELEKAAKWIKEKKGRQVTVRDFQRYGPGSLRDRAKQILNKLCEIGKAEHHEQPGKNGDLYVLV